jgi:hypothetical protein
MAHGPGTPRLFLAFDADLCRGCQRPGCAACLGETAAGSGAGNSTPTRPQSCPTLVVVGDGTITAFLPCWPRVDGPAGSTSNAAPVRWSQDTMCSSRGWPWTARCVRCFHFTVRAGVCMCRPPASSPDCELGTPIAPPLHPHCTPTMTLRMDLCPFATASPARCPCRGWASRDPCRGPWVSCLP